MNIKKVLFVCFAITLFGLRHEICLSQNLVLSLNLDYDKYLESQGIWAYVAVINRSKDTQYVQQFILSDGDKGVRFKLIDENGKLIGQSVESTDDEPDITRKISPNDSISRMYNITSIFSNSGIRPAPPYLSTKHYLRAGRYLLQVKTFTGKDTLYSNIVRFVVVKPTGNELEALKMLRVADDKNFQLCQKNEQAIATAYDNFLKSFPKSIYAPNAYYHLIFLNKWPLQNINKAMELVIKLAENFPNDGETVYLMQGYLSTFIEKRMIDKIEKLARDYPNTRVGKFCKEKLNEINSKIK